MRRPYGSSQTARRDTGSQSSRGAKRRGCRCPVHHHTRVRQRGAQSGECPSDPNRSGSRSRAHRRVGSHPGHQRTRIEAGISTAFGCSLQGLVPENEVLSLATALAEAGVDAVALADTLGYGTPSQIRRLVRAVRSEIGVEQFGKLHLHDTLGLALANVLAALEEDVRGFDAALGGLGGCPYAPGSVGNASTEDLVYLLESEGFDTGIDLDSLLARARDAQRRTAERTTAWPGRQGRGTSHLPARPSPFPLRQIESFNSMPNDTLPPAADAPLPAPLAGLRVIEFSHMVMGPSCGMVLADLGADVVKIEPAPGGDNTRRLSGPAVGFFSTFNRNNRSLCIDVKRPSGLALVRRLIADADVLIENFRPGAMDKLGLGHSAMLELNPRLVYCSCKGFLPGPYEHRTALDEVVQMMGGLAYMTGPPGQPLRAGSVSERYHGRPVRLGRHTGCLAGA